ncbi:hypothetical protein Ptr902_01579 [Pyrenophora tritici-repentis]|uniref:Uncharacterized protein n=1 Tax=Pyrenophora tritici-repentis TaxID=45151 RepID=A0A5M9LNX0_9PLEO|nr:hypothetical protein PtrV1_01315 [Pyrenophora tritici-repentis]KAF7454053.1 hypothetical protein A1F99_013110 [Pyrenophora tritici-repentis]KAF7577142.1 hypothetical protein PtrM4_013820 [Pyrenophora tritici-repentis]KAI0581137.1 hypothetical protein Alg215_04836 [Pyrenophora tritici-repentis]KAI0591067.1 hypothetical protein Alg130_01594 [Pyrenophora tritici-repentis]
MSMQAILFSKRTVLISAGTDRKFQVCGNANVYSSFNRGNLY